MLSLSSTQLLNHPRKLFGIIRQHRACVCAHLHVVACVSSLCVLCAFLWAKEITVCKTLFAVLPFAACATLTIHVICMCVLVMCVFCLQPVYFPWCDFLIQTTLNRGLL